MDTVSIDLTTDTISENENCIVSENHKRIYAIYREDQLCHLLSAKESKDENKTDHINDSDLIDIIEIVDEEDSCNNLFQHNTTALQSSLNPYSGRLTDSSINEDEPSSSDNQTSPWICLYCEKTFRNYQTFDKHLRNEHIQINENEDSQNEKPKLHCDVCNENFFDDQDFFKHRLMHSRMMNFAFRKELRCVQCVKIFPSDDELKSHYEKEHTNQISQITNNAIQCAMCEMLFESKELLDEHTKTHSSPQTSEGKSEIKENQYVNKGNLLKCKLCFQCFPTATDLIIHLKTHNSSNKVYTYPYACNICSKELSSLNKLKNHMKIHSGRWSLTCHICSMGCAYSTILKSHMKMHTCTYNCKVRSIGFEDPAELEAHMRMHHECGFCSSTFTNQETLRKHVESCQFNSKTAEL